MYPSGSDVKSSKTLLLFGRPFHHLQLSAVLAQGVVEYAVDTFMSKATKRMFHLENSGKGSYLMAQR